MIFKILGLASSSLLGLALTAALPPKGPDEPPPSKKAKKEDRGPDELKKAYDILRRIRADNRSTGRPEDRLRDWTDRSTKYYREALKSSEKGQKGAAREYAIAAHDLARAVDHVRNAGSFNLDDDLPPPPAPGGPDGEDGRTRRDLRHAHDRIVDLRDEADGSDSKFYLEASKDLYNAARRDVVARRTERAGELARAAEALTHVPEHLASAADPKERPEPKAKKGKHERPEAKEKPEPKEKKEGREKNEKREKGEPKEKKDRDGAEGDELPPPID